VDKDVNQILPVALLPGVAGNGNILNNSSRKSHKREGQAGPQIIVILHGNENLDIFGLGLLFLRADLAR